MFEDITGRFNLNVQNIDKRQPTRTQIVSRIIKRQQIRQREDVGDWVDALLMAENVDHPDRSQLIKIFKQVDLDGHITGIINAFKDKIKARPFMIVDSNGDENEDLTERFEKEWFFKFLDFIIEAPFWGFSLVELGDIVDDGFPNIQMIPREYVVPERELVKKDLHQGLNRTEQTVFRYNERPLKDWFIFIGEEKNMGLFNKVAPHALSKKNLFAEMWEYAELFGMPIRKGHTDLNDPERRKNMENMVRDMGSAPWAVLDKDDVIDFVERSETSDATAVFIDPIKISNEEISKTFASQVATFDEKAFVGSAEVQERIFVDVTISKMRTVKFVVNNQLFPRMVFHRMLPPGSKFKWKEEEKLTVIQKSGIIKEMSDSGYQFSAETVTKEVGIEVESIKVEGEPGEPVNTIMNEVQALYSGFLK